MKTLAVLLCVFALARTARAQCELEVLNPAAANELALGRLDARGAAVATVTIPRLTDPALIGLRLHFAYVSGNASSPLPPCGASNAVPLELVP